MLHTNRLSKERSPYLQQHAHNPVDWYPWGDEAFKRAQAEKKPIFLSVGYSTCHWCHVMERETFEDEEIAAVMNENFVNIKLDREERPDVDSRYMLFVQATTGGGGWPMSVFLTPDLKPFFGGTYFPPRDSPNGIGFLRLLHLLNAKWKENPEAIAGSANRLHESLARAVSGSTVDQASTSSSTFNAKEAAGKTLGFFKERFDKEYGGFGGAPKFPTPTNLVFLLGLVKVASLRGKQTIDSEWKQAALLMVRGTLESIWMGGIHDHVGTGIHRYSVDRLWHVPHFEKMLYDQGQLLSVYSEALLVDKDPGMQPLYLAATRDIASYLQTSLRDSDGAFYCAEDADSLPTKDSQHKLEGAFAVWAAGDIDKILPEQEAAIFKSHYGVRDEGNVPSELDHQAELAGKNVLSQQRTTSETASLFGINREECERKLQVGRQILLDCRSNRPKPHLDDKILISWNALAITGLCKASIATKDQSYLAMGKAAFSFVKGNMINERGRLIRAYRQGPSNIEGLAADYIFLTAAALDLWQATLIKDYLNFAVTLSDTAEELFWEEADGGRSGSFYTTEKSAMDVNIRLKDDIDGAEPAVNSIAAHNLARLKAIMSSTEGGKSEHYEKMLQQLLVSGLTAGTPWARPAMVAAALFDWADPLKVTFLLPDADSADSPLSDKTIKELKESIDAAPVPKVYSVQIRGGGAAVILCHGQVCQRPVSSVADLKEQLKTMLADN